MFDLGDGIGGEEFQIANQVDGSACMKACYQRKLDGDTEIMGVSFGSRNNRVTQNKVK